MTNNSKFYYETIKKYLDLLLRYHLYEGEDYIHASGEWVPPQEIKYLKKILTQMIAGENIRHKQLRTKDGKLIKLSMGTPAIFKIAYFHVLDYGTVVKVSCLDEDSKRYDFDLLDSRTWNQELRDKLRPCIMDVFNIKKIKINPENGADEVVQRGQAYLQGTLEIHKLEALLFSKLPPFAVPKLRQFLETLHTLDVKTDIEKLKRAQDFFMKTFSPEEKLFLDEEDDEENNTPENKELNN